MKVAVFLHSLKSNFNRRFSQINLNNTSKRFTVKSTLYYATALGITMFGFTYAGVPIYRIFCQKSGIGGNTEFAKIENDNLIKNMKPIRDRVITVEFDSDKNSDMLWKCDPVQKEVKVLPGETALAFYRASNKTDKPITGIATYNILPVEAGKYFHKIQCFCFEEQRLHPNEEVDMPVFFFIDPAYDEDHKLIWNNKILLTYTFYEAKESLKLPLPNFLSSK